MGYDYVHVAVDDHSRLAYVEVLSAERGSTCAGFLRRASRFFAGDGITLEPPAASPLTTTDRGTARARFPPTNPIGFRPPIR